MLYAKFSDYLRSHYGTKVYKLPVNLPVTCPNRDGCVGTGGCIFCGEEGAGFETLSSGLSIQEQLTQNSRYIGENYGSQKFIAYFQNYSNTYLPLETFRRYMEEACQEGVVALYVSTRPDCIGDPWLDCLKETASRYGVDIVLELGLQTVNYRTLQYLNRGHSLAEFIDAMLRVKRFELGSCAHVIVDLPMDEREDVVECAKILSALGVDQVKCHSLYILRDTTLGDLYQKGMVTPVSVEEYVERAITFLEYLDPAIVIQRLVGRAPEERTLFCNWNTSWWKLRDAIEEKMQAQGRFQGSRFDYLNGKTLRKQFK